MASTRTAYRCSFCGKNQEQVRRLIAGPGGISICDECVGLCTEIIVEEHGPDAIRGGWKTQVRHLSRKGRQPERGGYAAAAEEQDPGEWLFDTLCALGYAIAIGDDGHITATNEHVKPEAAPPKIEGQVRFDGGIEWPDDEQVRSVLFYSRLVALRSRAAPAQSLDGSGGAGGL